MPETTRFAFLKACLSQAVQHVLEKAIPSLSSYPDDSESLSSVSGEGELARWELFFPWLVGRGVLLRSPLLCISPQRHLNKVMSTKFSVVGAQVGEKALLPERGRRRNVEDWR